MLIIKNNFIPFGDYTLMNVFGIILFSKGDYINPISLNHEKIHSRQILECAIVASLILLILIPIFGDKDTQLDRYHEVSLEEEAHNNDTNLDYLKDRKPFSQMKYIKINTYE